MEDSRAMTICHDSAALRAAIAPGGDRPVLVFSQSDIVDEFFMQHICKTTILMYRYCTCTARPASDLPQWYIKCYLYIQDIFVDKLTTIIDVIKTKQDVFLLICFL